MLFRSQKNTAAELIQRIETAPLAAIDRQDIPDSLQRVLARAMAKRPGDRYQSALAFARALQTVQIELALGVTPVDILDDSVPEEVEQDADDGLTRVRGVVSIDPQTSPAAGLTRPSATTAPPGGTSPALPGGIGRTLPSATGPTEPLGGTAVPDETIVRDAALGETIVRPPASPPPPAPSPQTRGFDETTRNSRPFDVGSARTRGVDAGSGPGAGSGAAAGCDAGGGSGYGDGAGHAAADPDATRDAAEGAGEDAARRRRTALWIGISAAVVVVLAIVVIVASLPGIAPAPKASPSMSASAVPQDVNPVGVPAPARLAGTVQGKSVVFTWQNTAPERGDRYGWSTLTELGASDVQITTQTTVTVPAAAGRTCVQVQIVRADGTYSDFAKACAP